VSESGGKELGKGSAIVFPRPMDFNGRVTEILVATRNRHKVGEINVILGPGFRCKSLADYGDAPEVVEDARTFAGNARKKALTVAGWVRGRSGLQVDYVLADDSGLEVDALAGAPGVHSARFAAEESGRSGNATDAANNAKLVQLLAKVPASERTARFRCVLALVERGGAGRDWLFDGACEGRIDFHPRGSGGFGYDPLFLPTGHEVSFAELGEAIKNQISHRAQALEKLKQHFQTGA
jgi:XTP/dITP diphosphohydrolase